MRKRQDYSYVKQNLAAFKASFIGNIRDLRNNFTARAFFTLLTGGALLAGNIVLFGWSSVIALSHGIFPQIIFFFVGLIGFCASCFLITVVSLWFAVQPQADTKISEGGIESDLKELKYLRGKDKARMLAIYIFVILFMVGGAVGPIGYYIADMVKYNSYPEATATIVRLIGSDDGVKCEYAFEADGVTYYVTGKVESSGSVLPNVGDKVTIRYNPENPNDVWIATEKGFFLAFGCFFLYADLIVIFNMLHSRGKLKIQFFLAYILLGLSFCIVLMATVTYRPHGFVEFFADNLWFHFILVFTNAGIIELFNGIIYLGYKENYRRKKR